MDERLLKQEENERLTDIIHELREENSQLQKENEDLNKKLSQAINDYQKSNNDKLSKQQQQLHENAKYIEENQELKSRLTILTNKYNEIEKSFEQFKKSTSEAKGSETQIISEKYNEVSRQIRLQKMDYENKIQTLQDELYKEKNQNASLTSLNNKLLHVSSLNYNQEISSIEDLIKIISTPKVTIVQNPYQEQIDSMNHQMYEYEGILKEAKKQIDLLTTQIQSIEDEKNNTINSYEAIIQQQKGKYKDKIKALKMAIKSYESNKDNIEDSIKQRDINRKFRNNSTQTDESKDSFIDRNDYDEKIKLINANTIEMEQLKSEINELYQINTQLGKEKERIQEETMKIANKVKSRIDEINLLKEKQQQLETSNNEKETILQQLTNENNKLNNELEKTKSTLNSSEQNISSINEALDFLAQEQENLSKEIESLTNQRDKSYSLILLFNNLLKTEEKCIEKQTQKIQEMKKELEQAKSNENNEDQLNYKFDFSQFPSELGKILSTITANDLISFNIRLNNVLSVISKWINNREGETKGKIQEFENKIDLIERKQFLSLEEIKKTTKDETVSIETLPKLILSLLEEKEKSEETAKKNATIIEKARRDNGIKEDENISDYIANLISTQNDLKQMIKSERQEMENEREVETQKKKALKEACRRKDDQIKILEKTNAHNRNQIEQLQTILSELQDNNKELLTRFNHTKESNANEYKAAQNQYEDEVYNKMQEIASLRASMTQQIQQLTNENKEQKNQIELLQASKQLLEENLMQKSADYKEISSKYYEINKVAQKNEEEITKAMQKKVDDANLIIKETNMKIDKLKDDHKNEITELSAKLAETEKNVNKLNNQISELGLKLKKGEREKKIREDSFQRSQKLLEAQTKAQLVIAETNSQMKLEEEKNKNEAKIRSIYTYFAEEFGTFYDASQKISEESFKELVHIVKKELEKARKQEQAVRLFFNANEMQSTEEAMTKYIIDNHPKLKAKL